jgi:hypothetical protein
VSSQEMRKSALRRYVVFRVKAIEFLDLNALRQSLKDQKLANLSVPLPSFPPSRPPVFVSDSVRTVVLSWFCLFIDQSKDGMDVIKLWCDLFPQHAKRIRDSWAMMEPAWPILREFRDRAGFHADKPLKFLTARHRLRSNGDQVMAAVLEFYKLLKFILSVEATELPDLEEGLDSLLDEMEQKHGDKYKREQYKAYLMIPNMRTNAVKK